MNTPDIILIVGSTSALIILTIVGLYWTGEIGHATRNQKRNPKMDNLRLDHDRIYNAWNINFMGKNGTSG